MFTEIYLTRNEVSEEAGCSYDTVRRAEKAGKLPNTRVGSNGEKEMRLDDLVAAKLIASVIAAGIYEVRNAAGTGRPVPPLAASRADRDVVDLRSELAVAVAKIEGLTEMLVRADREIAFHREIRLNAEVN